MQMSYISVIERYSEHKHAILVLLHALAVSMKEQYQNHSLAHSFSTVRKSYPFAELAYVLNHQGVQLSPDVGLKSATPNQGVGANRASRPYFFKAQRQDVEITEPYISIATGALCVSVSINLNPSSEQGELLVLDVNLACLVEYVMGDRSRSRFGGVFKGVFAVIVASLFLLVFVLMFTVISQIISVLGDLGQNSDPLRPFGIIIFITLALSIFDLGKTILEEEVLMHKDIFRHSATRRTITRFISTILIAVSIEALLTMFKASLGQSEYTGPALLMMLSVMGLLVGLGVYVFLGAKAELMLVQAQKEKQK